MTKILAREYQPVLEAIQQRSIRTSKAKVLTLRMRDGQKPPIGVPGMVLAFVGRKGSSALKLVRGARTQEGARKLIELLDAQRKKFKKVSLTKGIDMMLKEDVFAELRLGTEMLVQTLFVPRGADLVFEEFPYNGGPLPKEGFTLVERLKDGSREALEAVVIVIPPPVTKSERAAMLRVPSAQWPRNLASASCCGDSYTAVGVVVVAVVATLTLACLMPMPEVEPLAAAELKKLGPVASARKLLKMRQAAIMRNFPRH